MLYKYRVWSKKDKTMIYPDTISINSKDDRILVYSSYGFTNIEYTKNNLMMFSGLKDIDGHDIYEEDIIYVAGYGLHKAEFPFFFLYEYVYDGNYDLIEHIRGNSFENQELLKEVKM